MTSASKAVSPWAELLRGWDTTSGPRYLRLARLFQHHIEQRRLPSGQRLPAERELALLLGLSRSTVVAAYDQLHAGGFVQRRVGSGTRVAPLAPHTGNVMLLQSPVPRGTPSIGELDLTVAVPLLTPASQRRLQVASRDAFNGSHYVPLGLSELRVLLAEQYTHAGLATDMEQVIITTGAQQAIALSARTFLSAGDCALLETPTYFGAIDVIRSTGAAMIGLPVRRDGVSPQDFNRALTNAPRLAFLTPSFQNPTGALMPVSAREDIASMLHRQPLPLIEDDTLADLGLEGTLPPRIAAFDRSGSVISVGSLSKLFWAGLRVGWMRVPSRLLGPLEQAKTLEDFGSSLPAQHVALHLLNDLSALKAERRAHLRSARDLLVTLLRMHLPEWRFTVPEGGQFLWVELPATSAADFTFTAARAGVRLFPGSAMSVPEGDDSGRLDNMLRLPFTLPLELLPEAVSRLKRAWEVHHDNVPSRLV